jgi:alanine racemase
MSVYGSAGDQPPARGRREDRHGVSVRRALALVNVAAIERNCARLRAELRSGCELCVVVKADGYGHGAVQSARAALRGGAERLAVAGSSEALALRRAGLLDVPLLVMGALSPVELREALAADADVVVWREQHIRAVARAGGGRVHIKLDSGMGRLGTRDPEDASRVVEEALKTPGVELAGVMTHFATADNRCEEDRHSDSHGGGNQNDSQDSGGRGKAGDDDDALFFQRQLELFGTWAEEVKAAHPQIVVHAANSAAVLRERRSHFDMVRCGIAVYGMDPFGEDPLAYGLQPALELYSYVAEVKRCSPGESAGYGRSFIAERPTQLAVLPIGYGDGWRRGLSNDGEVLIGGAHRPLVGTVSMDNLTVDLGDDSNAEALRGSEAVLIGAQGERRITAEQVARRLNTINYEITCGLTGRVPRVYHRDGQPLSEGETEAAPAAAASKA